MRRRCGRQALVLPVTLVYAGNQSINQKPRRFRPSLYCRVKAPATVHATTCDLNLICSGEQLRYIQQGDLTNSF